MSDTTDYTPSIAKVPASGFDIETDTLIIGAGACGLVAALASSSHSNNTLVIESDSVPAGSTSLSAGLIPAAGTRLQQQAGSADTADIFAADIQVKAHNENPRSLVTTLSQNAATVIDWLCEEYKLPFSLVDDFDYPGHSHRRMHGLPSRSGVELIDHLRQAVENAGIDIICNRRATCLHCDGDHIHGVTVAGADNKTESIACKKLILACNGFGGNRRMVAEHMPEITEAVWFGHSGNQGDAIVWGEQLGAAIKHLGAYQGHGNVAHPHGILITWAVITRGGVQVNINGERFWNESQGYSEAARAVMAQPEGIAFSIFDESIADIARQFADFKQAQTTGAIVIAETLDELAQKLGLPADRLNQTVKDIPVDSTDSFGRKFDSHQLQPPFYGVKVTGALFHTQGGLMVDDDARVQKKSGDYFPNLFAGGGAACGVSGSGDSGYLSGNGLLSAVVLGYKAGLLKV